MRYDSSVEMTTGRVKATREEPTGSLRNAAIVFVLSLGSGFTVYIGVALIGWGAGWDSAPAKIASGIAILVVWGWFLFQYVPDLLWTIERVTKRDFDKNGVVGQPDIHQWMMKVNDTTSWLGELYVDKATLYDWCIAAQHGYSLSIDRWSDRFALPNGRSGRKQYDKFKEQLLREGIIEEVGGSVGIRLTEPKGWQVTEGFLTHTPLLVGESVKNEAE